MTIPKIIIANILLLNISFAAGESNYDIVPRVLNFVIFAGLLYYLLGAKLKDFLGNRASVIANNLVVVEEKIRQSKRDLESAKKEKQDAQNLTLQIKAENEKQISMILEKNEQSKQEQLKILSVHFQDHKSIMYRRMLQRVTDETLREVFKDALSNDDKTFVKTMFKKVGEIDVKYRLEVQ